MSAEPLPPNRRLPRRADPVALVWAGGIALAVVAYLAGPDHLIGSALDALERAGWYLDTLALSLTASAFEAMRAGAIGLFGVFVALSLLAIHRSGRGRGGLIVLAVVFVLLVWGAQGGGYFANMRWLAALLLSGGGALAATNRLLHPDGARGWQMPPPR